jgi:hypothetical protein
LIAEEFMARLAAVHNLKIFNMAFMASNLKIARDDRNPIVHQDKSVFMI